MTRARFLLPEAYDRSFRLSFICFSESHASQATLSASKILEAVISASHSNVSAYSMYFLRHHNGDLSRDDLCQRFLNIDVGLLDNQSFVAD